MIWWGHPMQQRRRDTSVSTTCTSSTRANIPIRSRSSTSPAPCAPAARRAHALSTASTPARSTASTSPRRPPAGPRNSCSTPCSRAARLAGSPGPRAVAYFWRRGLRILPAYWVALTITVFLLHVPKELPSVGDLFLFYGLFHLYSLGNVIGPILSSYTLVTEISFYVFLPLYALAISRWARGEPERQVRIDLVVLGCLIAAGIAYRWAMRSRFDGQRAFQLLNVLPGWIDVFAVGMVLAVISVWLSGRREPTVFRRRIFPAVSWTLATAAFVAISLLMGRPGRIDTLAQDMGVHYFYLAVGLFFLLPGIFGPQRVGLIRHVLENRVVQLLGLISYGLYLWNETLLEKYIEW